MLNDAKHPTGPNPLRIAFLVGHFPSRSETFVLNQISGLLDRGHDLHIYARKPDAGADLNFDAKYNLPTRVTYRAMPSNALLRGLKALSLTAQRLARPVPIFRALNIPRFGRQAASLNLLYWANAFLKTPKSPHILHAHFGPNGLIAVALKQIGAIPPSTKIVTTFYGYDVHRYPRNHGNDIYHPLFQHADLILTLSEVMKRDLAALGCPESKLVVHHIGADTRQFPFSPPPPPADGVTRLVSVARLVEKKGLEFAIKAIAAATSSGLRLHYDIIGDGDQRPALESLIRSLGLTDAVTLLGWKSSTQVSEILRRSHILLAPSVTATNGDQEGTPVALMEAMSMGLPVISTHHSGIPEMIRDGQGGYLVPERDADALAERIIHLARHPDQWRPLGQSGRQIVERDFDVHHLNDRLIQLYQTLRA